MIVNCDVDYNMDYDGIMIVNCDVGWVVCMMFTTGRDIIVMILSDLVMVMSVVVLSMSITYPNIQHSPLLFTSPRNDLEISRDVPPPSSLLPPPSSLLPPPSSLLPPPSSLLPPPSSLPPHQMNVFFLLLSFVFTDYIVQCTLIIED